MSGAVEQLRNAVNDAQASVPRRQSLAEIIKANEARILRSLPETTKLTPERLSQLAMTTIRANPTLGNCTPESLLGALMTAAQLGLEIGPLGHSYLVPFRRNKKVGPGKNDWETTWEATFIIGYRGILELARRSGEILSIEARTVHAKDDFDYAYGLDPKLHHKPALVEPGPAICYYGVARFKDGGSYFLVMSLDDINRIRDKSPSYNKDRPSGVWVDDYDAMARKTVIRQMAPYLPMSTDLARAFNADEQPRTVIEVDELDTPHEPLRPEPDVPALPAPEVEGAEDPLPTDVPDGEPFDLEPPTDVDAAGDGVPSSAEPAASAPDPRIDEIVIGIPDDVDSLSWLRTLQEADVRAVADHYGVELPSLQQRHTQKLAQRVDEARGLA